MDIMNDVSLIIGEIETVLGRVPSEAVENLLHFILGAPRIFVAGTGRSALMARAFAMRLMHLGLEVYVVGEAVTPAASKGDLLIVASGSGATESVAAIAAKAKNKGLDIALLTIVSQSPIGNLADCTIRIPSPSPKARLKGDETESVQPMGTLFEQAMMVLFDAMVLQLMKKKRHGMAAMFERHANIE